MTLAELKLYLRVDGSDEDAELTALLSAATGYIQRMTGKTHAVAGGVESDINTDELYNLCAKLLCAHWYENRGVEIAGSLTRITHSVDALVAHIAMCGDYT